MEDELVESLTRSVQPVRKARVIRVDKEVVWLEIGSKFESTLALSAWSKDDAPPSPGDVIWVMVEDDPETDDRPLRVSRVTVHVGPPSEWRKFLKTAKLGDIHTGRVARRINGGFIVHIGVCAFLPDEYVTGGVDADVNALIGQTGRWRITKIDLEMMSIEVAPA